MQDWVPYSSDLEGDLVRAFADRLAVSGIQIEPDRKLQGLIVGCEIALRGASQMGNTGAADLLLVTEDGRWWLVEAKLARSAECRPNFLFGNQLARYAQALEEIGLEGLHPRLQEYLYARRKGLKPPKGLAGQLAESTDLMGVLRAWCQNRGHAAPETEAGRLLGMFATQIRRRTLTLAALVDLPDPTLAGWVRDNADSRSLGVLTIAGDLVVLADHGLSDLETPVTEERAPLPPFNLIPQSYKPLPGTLPRVLSGEAYALFRDRLEPRFSRWTDGAWPEIDLSKVTTAAFSMDLRGESGREICLQLGRAGLAGGGGPGEHPLKLIVNLIWAAEQVYETYLHDQSLGEQGYADLEALVMRLCQKGGMLVRGIPRTLPSWGREWIERVQWKLRGDEQRRPEILTVREVGGREGYGWPDGDTEEDARLLEEALDAVEEWLGAPPYTSVGRRQTRRAVPGTVE